ncbi:predicted protein [Plenodomus lingam JN3]|uniref:Uncharacterized protein n=1 Tax=Leptosphaeria maculans (strain JN3 / isolate v23.1.3 / race Av1-4-5-6-7-8) TaxID=985895 RepID=E5A687_LEPMJ|nr:predicted protein [Plenodomus lingam JN3]CBX99132.1 predicted protein [Plenodomus lingam JN3]
MAPELTPLLVNSLFSFVYRNTSGFTALDKILGRMMGDFKPTGRIVPSLLVIVCVEQ